MQTISVIVIDSRSEIHPDWVQKCVDSIKNQIRPAEEIIIVPNTDRKMKIGEAWNLGVKQAKGDWCFFIGDDCFIARDCIQVMMNHTDHQLPCVTTYMTMFDEKDGLYRAVPRPCTGMWRREYLLKYPFNEELEKGIDREYFQEAEKRCHYPYLIDYYYGHYDRRHDDHRSGKVKLQYPKERQDIYITCSGGANFIEPLALEWKKTKKVVLDTKPFNPKIKADIIWCEWANENAITVSEFKTDAKKFLRIHAYEAYTPVIFQIKWDAFEKVIFIAEHIKDRVEALIGELPNAVVIPVGVEGLDFQIKEKNNKIAYAGQISRKKGAGELMLIAKSLPNYEFHIAGKYLEDDTADYFNFQKPDNMFIHPYSYDLNEFFKDKTYFINTSIREGNPITVLEAMSAGLKPLIRDWVGSEVYKGYTYKNIDELKELLDSSYEPEEYRKFAENYDIKKTLEKIKSIMPLQG